MANRRRGRMQRRMREPRQPEPFYNPADYEGDTNSMANAICDPTSGEPITIDAVIDKLKEGRTLNENQSISYIGSGKFAVVTMRPSGKKRFSIDEVINYESDSQKGEWRAPLRRKSNMPYTPEPAPLSKLYTLEEQQNMPKF